MAAADELVEWVDPDGNVIDVVTRKRMRAEVLRHRSVYVVVANTACAAADSEAATDRPGDAQDRAIVVHKRADWKDYRPGAWDLAFGGVCDPGETWVEAAVRELGEEAGVIVSPTDLDDQGPVRVEMPESVRLLGRVFIVRYDGPFSPDDGEVTELRWLPIRELDQFMHQELVPEDSAEFLVPLIRRLG